MFAFNNDITIKEKYVSRLSAHQAADEVIKGVYWEGGKGCAVGCTIHGDDHAAYETELGIPQMLAQLEDCIFEGLPNKDAKNWPLLFLNSIAVGADLSLVGWKFLYWNLTENLVLKDSADARVQEAIIQCRRGIGQCAEALRPLTKGEPVDDLLVKAAQSAARSAVRSAQSAQSAAWSAESARSAARSAAWSVWSAWSASESVRSAVRSAESAAWSAESARSAAESARSAAWSASESVWSARSAESARSASESAESARSASESAARLARSAAYKKMADKIIQLLGEAA